MPTDRQTNIYDMFGGTLAFNTLNAGDYASIPDAAIEFASVQAAYDALAQFFATQTSGERAAAVELKVVLRAAIRRKMTRYAKTARALNLTTPGFDKLFKVPDSNSDDMLVATGREFVEQALAHQTEFASLGIAKTLALSLTADLDALEAAQLSKVNAQGETVGATAGVENAIETGMEAEKKLDAIMTNVYYDDPVKLAQWHTARHVKSASQTPTPPTPPTP